MSVELGNNWKFYLNTFVNPSLHYSIIKYIRKKYTNKMVATYKHTINISLLKIYTIVIKRKTLFCLESMIVISLQILSINRRATNTTAQEILVP